MDQQQTNPTLGNVCLPEEGNKIIDQTPSSPPTLVAMSPSKPSRQTIWNGSASAKPPNSTSPEREGSLPLFSGERSEVSSTLRSQPRSPVTQPKIEPAHTPKPKSKPKRKPLNFCGPQTFTTILTDQLPNQQTFTLHTSLLTHSSPFFRQALNNPSLVETRTQTMTLPHIDSTLFSIVVNWLYMRKILPAPSPPSSHSPSPQESTTGTLSQLTLHKLHTLTLLLQIPTLQNEIIHELAKYEFSGSLEDCITEWKALATYAFGKEMRGSILREKVLEDLGDVYLLLGNEEVREVFLERVFGGAATGVLGMLLRERSVGGEEKGVERFLVAEESDDEYSGG